MRLIDADALKFKNVAEVNGILTHILTAEEIDNAPTVEYPDVITIKCDTEEDKQKILSAFRNAKLSGKVIPDNLAGWRYEE